MHTALLADGIPDAVRFTRHQQRLARARVLSVLAFGTLAEAILLLMRARLARNKLRASLATHGDIDQALLHAISGGERFWLKLVIASALIASVFAAFALLLWLDL
jgi:hypothetical protein